MHSRILFRFCHYWEQQSDKYLCLSKCLNIIVTIATAPGKLGTLSRDRGTTASPASAPIFSSKPPNLYSHPLCEGRAGSVNHRVVLVRQKKPQHYLTIVLHRAITSAQPAESKGLYICYKILQFSISLCTQCLTASLPMMCFANVFPVRFCCSTPRKQLVWTTTFQCTYGRV